MEFAEVLEARIRREVGHRETLKTPHFPSETEIFPSGMAWLMGQLERQNPSAVQARRAYGVRPKPRRPHDFDATQAKAYSFLKKHVSELDLAFSPRELKAAYRKAALILHPDQGGTAPQFRELHEAFQHLRTIFHKKS